MARKSDWISTKEMAELVGVSRRTLQRLQSSGFLKPGQHWQKSNPESPRSNHVWHETRTMLRMGRI